MRLNRRHLLYINANNNVVDQHFYLCMLFYVITTVVFAQKVKMVAMCKCLRVFVSLDSL